MIRRPLAGVLLLKMNAIIVSPEWWPFKRPLRFTRFDLATEGDAEATLDSRNGGRAGVSVAVHQTILLPMVQLKAARQLLWWVVISIVRSRAFYIQITTSQTAESKGSFHNSLNDADGSAGAPPPVVDTGADDDVDLIFALPTQFNGQQLCVTQLRAVGEARNAFPKTCAVQF